LLYIMQTQYVYFEVGICVSKRYSDLQRRQEQKCVIRMINGHHIRIFGILRVPNKQKRNME
jgi:hypothetical protein